jgi:hypothetical protein
MMGFDFEQIIAGAPPSAVFAAIEAWLERERATIKRRKPPVYLEAVHGRRLRNLAERDGRKLLEFKLQGTASSTTIHVRVVPISYDAAEIDPQKAVAAQMAYEQLLGGLWKSLAARRSA